MIARYYGKITDPVDLNKALKANNLYIGTDELADDALTKIYPDIIYQESLVYPNDPPTPADLTKLKELMDDPTLSVILEIDMGNGSTHFVVCVGVNGVVTIDNPWDKAQEDFAYLYGDPVRKVIKYVVYKGTPASVDQQLLDQLRQQRDNNWNLYQEQITTNQIIQTQLTSIQKQLDDANTRITNLKTEISQTSQSAANLATALANKNKEDSTAIDEGIVAVEQENTLRDCLHAIAARIGIATTDKKDGDLTEAVLANIDVMEVELKNRNKTINTLKESLPQKVVDAIMNQSFWQKIKVYMFGPS